MRIAGLGCLVVLLAAVSTQAADERPASWQPYFRQLAGEWKLPAETGRPAYKLIPQPVMLWSQPVRGGDDGAVYVWLDGTRPIVIATFFVWPRGDGTQGVCHEMQSLSTKPLVGTWRDGLRWDAPGEAIRWQTIPKGPSVPAGEAGQKLQIKALSRRFTAETFDKAGKTWTLRLQPRAMFEYVASEQPMRRGALYSFVQGTDTELVLMIEATADEKAPWRFAFARMTDLVSTVKLDGVEVWHIPQAEFNDSKSAYYATTPEFMTEPPKLPDVESPGKRKAQTP